jgi:hypothetical protein
VHERALVARDIAGLRRLEAGAAALYEPGAVACGCLDVTSPRPLLAAEYFVPRQTSYPAHFLVEAQSSAGGSPWAEILVFTRSGPHARWLVAEDSGFGPPPGHQASLGQATIDRDGYVQPPSTAQGRRAKQVAAQLAAVWQDAKDTGRIPTQTIFSTEGQPGYRLAQIAAHRQDAVQANGLAGHFRFYVDRSDPLYEFGDGGFDLACQVVRETVVYSPAPGSVIVQDDARASWGLLLAPGRYPHLTSRDAWQTCFLISPVAGAPVVILNQDVGGGVPSAR